MLKCTIDGAKCPRTVVARWRCGATGLAPNFLKTLSACMHYCDYVVTPLDVGRRIIAHCLIAACSRQRTHPRTTASCAAPALSMFTSFPSLDVLYICMASAIWRCR